MSSAKEFKSFKQKNHLPEYPGAKAVTGSMTSQRMYRSTIDPTVNNDSRDTLGINQVFAVSDLWWNVTDNIYWKLHDSTAGSAVWGTIGNDLGTKRVDETNLANGSFPWYNSSTGKFEYNVRWDDIRIPITNMKPGISNDPTFEKMIDDGSGSTGVFSYSFAKNSEDEMGFSAQLPHSYKEGTDLDFHVHWAPSVGTDTGDVVWGLEYQVKSIDGTYSTSTIVEKTIAASGTALKHTLTDVSEISGTGLKISAMIMGRIFRKVKAVGDGGYDDKVWLLEADFHFQMNTVGSQNETSK